MTRSHRGSNRTWIGASCEVPVFDTAKSKKATKQRDAMVGRDMRCFGTISTDMDTAKGGGMRFYW